VTEVNGTPVWSAYQERGVAQAVMSLMAEFYEVARPVGYFREGGAMTMASRPPWGTTRESVTTWLGRYGRPVFNATGVVRGSVKYPKLGEGDATAIVSAAGLDDLEDLVIDTDAAICDHLGNLDSGADCEELQESRDGAIEEFIWRAAQAAAPRGGRGRDGADGAAVPAGL
jgi:hypothetical protein